MARVRDLKRESDALYGGYLAQAIHFSLAGLVGLDGALVDRTAIFSSAPRWSCCHCQWPR